MSLDIYLYGSVLSTCECVCESCGNKHEKLERNCLNHFNLTHNLNKMADEAFLYDCLWRPDEMKIEFAHQMIPFLDAGIDHLEKDPCHFKIFQPFKGYGTYETLLKTVKLYLAACMKNPDAKIEVCR